MITITALILLASCSPRVATSFWRIGTPADSTREGYAVLHEGTKVRHCYPVTEWTENLSPITDNRSPVPDTYHSFHHHGVAVENELIAYRIYFDKKQTIDVYCKRTPQLELATSYWYPNDSLLAAGYGDDILRVSGTVGVGSVKYWDGKMRHIENVTQRAQRILKQQKDQATIEVADYGWEVEGRLVNMSVQYTLKKGDRHMRCDVYTTDSLYSLCTGVQSIPAKGPNDQSQITNYQLENGVLLVSWGTDWPVNDTVKYAKETVGLAVFIPYPYAGEFVQDKSNNLCLIKPKSEIINHKSEIHCHFYLTVVGATKENHPVATTYDEWIEYLLKWAKKLR